LTDLSWGTKLLEVPKEQVRCAPWNPKPKGTPEQRQKLNTSIHKDKSAGVLAVRELVDPDTGEKYYETLDGNHRVAEIHESKYETVRIENFGTVHISEAIVISRKREGHYFDTDLLQAAELYKDEVLPVYENEDFSQYMPDNHEDILKMVKMLDSQPEMEVNDNQQEYSPPPETEFKKERLMPLQVWMPESVFLMWSQWRDHVSSEVNYDSVNKAFELAVAEAVTTIGAR